MNKNGLPAQPVYSRTRSMIICGIFAALTAVGAFIRIPMPLFDYITLQTVFVLLAGMLLGSKRGALALIIYLLIGLSGVPIFAAGGGITYIFRPSFGFLLGFIMAAWITGRLTENMKQASWMQYFLAGFTGLAGLYALGIAYKYLILNYYLGTPLSPWLIFLSFLPIDIPKDILLCFATAFLASRLRSIMRKQGW